MTKVSKVYFGCRRVVLSAAGMAVCRSSKYAAQSRVPPAWTSAGRS